MAFNQTPDPETHAYDANGELVSGTLWQEFCIAAVNLWQTGAMTKAALKAAQIGKFGDENTTDEEIGRALDGQPMSFKDMPDFVADVRTLYEIDQ